MGAEEIFFLAVDTFRQERTDTLGKTVLLGCRYFQAKKYWHLRESWSQPRRLSQQCLSSAVLFKVVCAEGIDSAGDTRTMPQWYARWFLRFTKSVPLKMTCTISNSIGLNLLSYEIDFKFLCWFGLAANNRTWSLKYYSIIGHHKHIPHTWLYLVLASVVPGSPISWFVILISGLRTTPRDFSFLV